MAAPADASADEAPEVHSGPPAREVVEGPGSESGPTEHELAEG